MNESRTTNWCGRTFTSVCCLDPDRDARGQPLVFMPQPLYPKAASKRLNPHGAGQFCRFRIPASWTGEGVYIITRNNEPMYVGKCDDLAFRFNTGYGQISPANCYVRGRPTNCKINKKVLQQALATDLAHLWFLQTTDKVRIEQHLIDSLTPPWNGPQR
jgi:hypothetical protein